MHINNFIKEIDSEITKLTQIKQLAQEIGSSSPSKPTSTHVPRGPYKKRKRSMSPEARAKISKAVKARWAASKKKAA